jgi:hypothetical protein
MTPAAGAGAFRVMAVARTMLIIAALLLGWIAMRTETFASNTAPPPAAAPAKPTPR